MSVVTREGSENGHQIASERPLGTRSTVQGQAEKEMDLLQILGPLWRRKFLLATCMLAALAAGAFAALKLDNRYTATTRVIYEPERLQIIDLTSVIAPTVDSETQMRNQTEILRSAVLLERVIDTVMLERTPEFNPELRPQRDGFLPSAAAEIPWPAVVAHQLAKLGLVPDPSLPELSPQEKAARLRADVVEQLTEELSVRPVPGSQVIEIAYRSTNPVLAAAIVNATAEQYIIVQTERKRDDVAQATELLGTRVRDLENRLNTAEEAVRLAQVELSMGGEYGSTIMATQIEALHEALGDVREERRILEERLARAAQALDGGEDFFSNPDFRASSIIGGFQLREANLRDEAAAIRSIVANESDPRLRQIEARLSEIRRNIRDEAGRIIAGLENQVRALQGKEATLQAEVAELERKATEQSQAEMRLAQLQREAEARRTIYANFLNRMNETSEQAALQSPDARFLARATVPTDPDNSLRLAIVAAALLAGAALGIGIIILLERLHDSFRNSSEVEEHTGLTVFAGIPRTGRRSVPRQLLATLLAKPQSSLAESTRNLRTSILFSNLDQAPKVVMFASSLPGEGKTTTAMLTAVTSQQMERSAVIVDCDLRRRALTRVFPIDPEQPGLFAALQGTASIDEAVYVEPETGVHVLAPERAGHGLGNPADILASRRFQRLIAQLRARYDLVILDTPPALAVTDVRIAAQYADAVVYLVRWNSTRRKAVLGGLRELRSVNAKVAGVALTLVDEKQADRYFAGDYLYKQSYGT